MSEEEDKEEKKEGNPTINVNEESGSLPENQTISKDQNTITSDKNKSKKKKPSELQLDSKNSKKETKDKSKYKKGYSTQSLK